MRRVIGFVHNAMVRVAGILCALSAYAVYSKITTWDPVPGEALVLLAPLGLCAFFCLMPNLQRALMSPQKLTDLAPSFFVAAVLPMAVLLYNSPDTRLLPTLEGLGRLEAALVALPMVITSILLVILPQPEVRAPQILKRHWIDGTPWRSYLIADFVAMRLFGLALLGVGAVLYQLIESGRPELASALSFGQPVQLALYGYGALGLLMVLPIFLPAFLNVPKSPLEGVFKAAFTLGIAVVLANAVAQLWPAVVVAASPITLSPEVTSIPGSTLLLVIQTIAAISALLSVVLPLARRAAGLRYDAEGRPLITLSAEELRRLRRARTALN